MRDSAPLQVPPIDDVLIFIKILHEQRTRALKYGETPTRDTVKSPSDTSVPSPPPIETEQKLSTVENPSPTEDNPQKDDSIHTAVQGQDDTTTPTVTLDLSFRSSGELPSEPLLPKAGSGPDVLPTDTTHLLVRFVLNTDGAEEGIVCDSMASEDQWRAMCAALGVQKAEEIEVHVEIRALVENDPLNAELYNVMKEYITAYDTPMDKPDPPSRRDIFFPFAIDERSHWPVGVPFIIEVYVQRMEEGRREKLLLKNTQPLEWMETKLADADTDNIGVLADEHAAFVAGEADRLQARAMKGIRAKVYNEYKPLIPNLEYAQNGESRIINAIVMEVLADLKTVLQERGDDTMMNTSEVRTGTFHLYDGSDASVEWSIWEAHPIGHSVTEPASSHVFAKATINCNPETGPREHRAGTSVGGHGFVEKSSSVVTASEIRLLLTNSLRAAIATFMDTQRPSGE
jgi:hypothetical protein